MNLMRVVHESFDSDLLESESDLQERESDLLKSESDLLDCLQVLSEPSAIRQFKQFISPN